MAHYSELVDDSAQHDTIEVRRECLSKDSRILMLLNRNRHVMAFRNVPIKYARHEGVYLNFSFEGMLPPKGHVFDGELAVLDDAGRPQFDGLLFGRRRPSYVAFDLLMADGVDLRPLPR